jgi:hypothetical protein
VCLCSTALKRGVCAPVTLCGSCCWWAGIHRPAAAAACQSFFYDFYKKLTELPVPTTFAWLLFCWPGWSPVTPSYSACGVYWLRSLCAARARAATGVEAADARAPLLCISPPPTRFYCCLLHVVCCVLHIVYCILSIAYWLLSVVYWLLSIVYCILSIACCLLAVVYCLLSIVSLLYIVYWLLAIVCCLLSIVYCLLAIDYCILYIVCCLLAIVY